MTAPKARPGRPALSLGRTGDLPAALTALATARDQAAHGRRVIKAAATGRRAPATRPGALRDLVEEHLRKFPERGLHPAPGRQGAHPVGRRGRQRPDKLVSLGAAQMVTDKPRSYRIAPAALAPATDTADDPGVSAAATPSAA